MMNSGSPIENKTIQPQEVLTEPAIALPAAPPRWPLWRFWAPLLFQSLLILSVPAQDAYTYATGRPVTLQTAPVDPYDFLRGYSQTLSYNISNPETLKVLPGGKELFARRGNQFDLYVTLEAPKQTTVPPQPWKPVAVSPQSPDNLAANQVVIKGQYRGWRVLYGLETYYMPEDQRNYLNTTINQVGQRNQRAFVVDVKVDAQGNSVPVSLWIEQQNYRF